MSKLKVTLNATITTRRSRELDLAPSTRMSRILQEEDKYRLELMVDNPDAEVRVVSSIQVDTIGAVK